ncbi:glycosyl transferase family 8 domain-containing protein [Hirsutella rhossiliensis]|uniref:glycogenin glucosyltransferase n=1 Tax=Hirsutella rhossiliensis TaxID=111463 RepID=A0A9P8N1V8_9HYPO|nr:glycosyl transferase family 8 domain-containing protein [Hirsutella rhossiliensis]KAH0964406.1 glycosyl transferase family 8 domain-containing protein [Hirsutella rhossiliensis]
MAGEQIYATLLLGDSYLPGALVLAHSLRDAGATNKLAVLVTLDSVSADAITQLKTVYDYVCPVPRIRNDQPANLYLMNRPDLHSAFTKINLWKQTQFSKIVYIDADVVAYRAPDELFNLPHAFAAAPDTGWPDLFNSGVMVLTPNMGDFYAMLAMAERGISMDGADQGLLNMHFGPSFHRLSFTYNVTPSAHYQYVPAYRHFQSSISMVHFIGANKPWLAGREAYHGSSPYDEMVGRWWAVHDRHYRARARCPPSTVCLPAAGNEDANLTFEEPSSDHAQFPSSQPVQSFGKQDSKPQLTSAHGSSGESHGQGVQVPAASSEAHQPWTSPGASIHASSPGTSLVSQSSGPANVSSRPTGAAQPAQQPFERQHQQASPPQGRAEPPELPMTTWDAQRQPPPPDSKPEAINFPSTHYEMSRDIKPFVPPVRYPSPPKNMWYEVPGPPPPPPADTPPPIFPWEKKQPKPPRVSTRKEPEVPPAGQASRAMPSEPVLEGSKSEPQTPIIKIAPLNPWSSFPRLNAWDDVPEIGRYVEGLQKHRRVKSQGAAGGSPRPSESGFAAGDSAKPRIMMRLTDFPSEAERPSLPVTPAPVRRPSYFGEDAAEPGRDGSGNQPLPAAEGVPAQTEWDPAEQLQKLAKQQSEAILRKLGGEAEGPQGTSLPPSVLSPQPVKREVSAAGMETMAAADAPGGAQRQRSAS